MVGDVNAQLQNVNTQMRQQLGLFNPEVAVQVDAINKQLAQYGTDFGTVAGALALIAAGRPTPVPPRRRRRQLRRVLLRRSSLS